MCNASDPRSWVIFRFCCPVPVLLGIIWYYCWACSRVGASLLVCVLVATADFTIRQLLFNESPEYRRIRHRSAPYHSCNKAHQVLLTLSPLLMHRLGVEKALRFDDVLDYEDEPHRPALAIFPGSPDDEASRATVEKSLFRQHLFPGSIALGFRLSLLSHADVCIVERE